jgi:hypothetical protein
LSRYWLFQDESGEPGKEDYFIVGILGMTSPVKNLLIKKVESVKHKHNFHNELHFQKFSRKREMVYKEVIEEAFKCYISFRSIVVPKNKLDLRNYFSNKPHLAYNKFTSLLVYSLIKGKSGDIHIRPDYKNRLKEDNFYEYLITHLNLRAFEGNHNYVVKSCKSVNSKDCVVAQVCDLLTGVVKNKYSPAGERKNNFCKEIMAKHEDRIKIWLWDPS